MQSSRNATMAAFANQSLSLPTEIVDDAALRAPWFLAVATNEDSVGRLRGQPSGVFVVRQSNTIPNAFIMSYRHNRKTHHVVLPWDQDGVCLVQSSKVFPNLSQLVYFYSQPYDPDLVELPCALRGEGPPNQSTTSPMGTMTHGHNGHNGYLQPHPATPQNGPGRLYEQPSPSYGGVMGATAANGNGNGASLSVGGGPMIPEGRTLFVFDVITGEEVHAAPNVVVQRGRALGGPMAWPSPAGPAVPAAPAAPAAPAEPTEPAEAPASADTFDEMGQTTPAEVAHRKEVARRKKMQRSNNSRLSHEHWMLEHVQSWMVADRAVEEWQQAEVIDWLVSNGLVEFVEPFKAAGIDGEQLLRMKDMDMEEMGISVESRSSMRRNLRKMPPTRSSIRRQSTRRSSGRSSADTSLQLTRDTPPGHRDSWADLSLLASQHPPTSPQIPVREWDVWGVRNWLQSADLEEFVQVFQQEGVDGPQLLTMDMSDLRAYGLMRDAANHRLLRAIGELKVQDDLRRSAASGRPDNVQAWSAAHVAGWLAENGHADKARAFQDAAINGLALTALTSIDLEQVGVTDVGQQADILRLVAPLREGNTAMAVPALDGSDANAAGWDPWHVRDWLVRNGLHEHAKPFDRSAVNGHALLNMTARELGLMGILDPADQNEIMEAVRRLQGTAAGGRSPLGARSTSFHESQRRGAAVGGSKLRQSLSVASVGSQLSVSGSETELASTSVGSTGGGGRFVSSQPPVHLPSQWTIADVGDWLVHNKFGYLTQTFCDAGIDGNRLLRMAPNDLVSLGILRPVTQQALMDAVNLLRRQQMDALAGHDAKLGEGIAEDLAARLSRHNSSSALSADEGAAAANDSMFANPPFSVEVSKKNGSFGFSIVGGAAHDLPPTVSEVREDGPAAGRLQRGDRVLTVNRRDLADGTHSEIIALIRRSGDTLLLSVLRPQDVPRGLSRAASRVSLRSAPSHNSSLHDVNADARSWLSRSRTSLSDFPVSPLATSAGAGAGPWAQPPLSPIAPPSAAADRGSQSSLAMSSPRGSVKRRSETSVSSKRSQPAGGTEAEAEAAAEHHPRSATLLVPVLSWDVKQTEQWIAERGYPNLKRRVRSHRVDGPALLLLSESDVQTLVKGEPDCLGVWPLVKELQEQSPAVPPAVKWSVAEVGLWLEHNGLGDLRKPFAKRRISGRELLCPAAGDDALTSMERQQTAAALGELRNDAAEPEPERVRRWSVPEVCDWLQGQGAGGARASFTKHKVAGAALLGLSHDSLFKMGIRQTEVQTAILNGISAIVEEGGEEPGSNDPLAWTVNEVLDWLAHTGFGEVCGAFLERRVGGVELFRLTQDELVGFGIAAPVAQDILTAVGDLRNDMSGGARPQELARQVSRSSRRSIGDVAQMQPEVAAWGLARVGAWLDDNGLGHMRQEFQRNSVTGAGLLRLTPDDLDRMNISGERDRAAVFTAVAALRLSGAPTPRSPVGRRAGPMGSPPLPAIASESSIHYDAEPEALAFPPGSGQGAAGGTAADEDGKGVAREPFSWWQLGVDADVAEDLLAHGCPVGSFVIYDDTGRDNAFVLAYKAFAGRHVAGGIERLDIGFRQETGRVNFQEGFYLEEAANVVYPDLHHLVEYLTKANAHLPMPLTISLRPRADANARPYLRRKADTQPEPDVSDKRPLSWLQLGVGRDAALSALSSRSAGAFVIHEAGDGSRNLVMSVRVAGGTEALSLTRVTDEVGVFHGFKLPGAGAVCFLTLHDLVMHMVQTSPLGVGLRVSPLDAGKAPILSPVGQSAHWLWCQIGVDPTERALAPLDRQGNGAFVVRDGPDKSDFTELTLSYKHNGQLHHEPITMGCRSDNSPEAVLADHPSVRADSLENLLRALSRESPLLCKLRLPAAVTTTPRTYSPMQTRRNLVRTDRHWDWKQLGVPEAAALSNLADKATGAFVVRDHFPHPDRYVLSYKINTTEMAHEGIRKRKGGLGGGGYYLELNELKKFKDLEGLVAFLTDDGEINPLKCRLKMPPPPSTGAATPAAGLPADSSTPLHLQQGEAAQQRLFRTPAFERD